MTAKQQKIGLVSSCRERRVHRESSPALSDYFKCSAEVVSSTGAVCIINRALVLIDYTFKWFKVSSVFLLYPSRSPPQPVMYGKAGLEPPPRYPDTWAGGTPVR